MIMRLFNETKFVIPFFLFLIFVLSSLLYYTINERRNASDHPTIGVITFKNKTVLRKFNDGVVWDSIESKAEVKNRDTIRTEGLSDAVLTLNDGTKINIAENSMILLDISNKNININFAYGSFQAAREGSLSGDLKMNITAGDKTVEVGKGDIKLDKTKSELNIKVGEGEAKISSNGLEETVGKDQVASVSDAGMQISKPIFNLKNPEDKKNILTNKNTESVRFVISGVSGKLINQTNPVLEVSLFPDFTKTVVKEKLKSETLTKTLNEGSYYWRVVYDDTNSKRKLSTEIGRFRILSDPPLKILTPKEGEVFSYTADSPVVRISWSPLDLYSSYTVTLARDNSLSLEKQTKQTQGQSIAFDGLKEGTYFYKIEANSNIRDIESKKSSVSKFILSKKLNSDPPELLEPSNGKSFTEEQTNAKMFFSWKDNRDFENFKLEVSSDSSFQNPIITENSKSNFLKITKGFKPGTYFWRVFGFLNGKSELVSKPFQFAVVLREELSLLSPTNGFDVETNESSPVILKWKKLSNTNEYTIEISKSKDFQNSVVKENVNTTYFEFQSKVFGRYFWRVRSDQTNEEIVSEVRNFQLISNMESPVLISPERNETVDLVSKNFISFVWKPTRDALSYRLKIFDVSGIKEKQILNEKVSTTKYTFSDIQKLNVGRFRWEVSSLYRTPDGNEKESNSTRMDFFISIPTLKSPKILTPGTIYVE
ncbi:FecR domain-containing protein [Leptospira sp. 96542]|nr:FecR domain-containing protein [Leptospira sp. 96542]